MLAINTRAHAFLDIIPQAEINFTTSLGMGEMTVEIPGRYSPLEAPTRPDPIVLPDLRTLQTTLQSHASTSAPSSNSHVMCVKHMKCGRSVLRFNVRSCSPGPGNVG
jgi:hypothetical protein